MINRRRWQSVLFDLDGTLYDYQIAHTAALDASAAEAEVTLGVSRARFLAIYDEARHVIHRRLRLTAASHSRLLYFNELVAAASGKQDIDLATLLEQTYWTTFYSHMTLYSGAIDLLRRLRETGTRLAIVTDMTTAIQFRKIGILCLTEIFDVVITSEDAGCEKPDPEIFALCLAKLNATAAEAVHIGDDFERDVMGARAAGIQAVLMAPRGGDARLETAVVRSFEELGVLLRGSPARA